MKRSALSVLFVLCAGTLSHAAERRYAFEQVALENGMKVITLEDHSCPIVAVQVWYHVGAKDEKPNRQGFAHMFEHMMFRGTDRLDETAHFDNIRRVGGDCNAYTAFDQTVYVEDLPSNQLELVLWLESERMAFLKVDEKGFKTERKVVEEELRQGHNTPYGRVPEKLLAEIYGKTPYAWTPGGQIEHLRQSSIDDLQAFWDTYYVPNNATLVVVGDIRHADVQAMARKYFGWIPRCDDPPRADVEPNKQTKPRTIKIEEDKGPLPVVGIAYRVPPDSHPDFLAIEALMGILGGGESSRLYVDIVKDQKIAQIAMAAAFGLEKDGLAAAGGVLLPLGKKEALMKTIRKHLDRVQEEPVTAAELDKMKRQMRREEVMGAMTVANKARLLGQYAVIFGDAERINRRLDEIDALAIEDVQRVAKKYLGDSHRMTILVEPSVGGMIKNLFSKDEESPPEEKGQGAAPNRVAERTGPKSKAVRPKDFPSTPPQAELLAEFPKPPTGGKTMGNGLKVVVVENHEVPMVEVRLGIRSGTWTEKKIGAASFAMRMLTKGTTTRDAKKLAEVLESNAIELNGSASMDTATVSAGALIENVELAMELLADVVRHPTFPKDEFDILRNQTRMGLLISTNTPEYLADREMRRRLFGAHPYSRTVTGELADLDAVGIDDLRSWWNENVRPDNCVIYLAGDLDPAAGFKLVEKHLGDWKFDTEVVLPDVAAIPEKSETHIYLVDRPGSVQSQIRVGHLGITRSSPGYFTSRVLGNIFGGGFNSRLNKAIRVEKGLTYGARGGFPTQRFAGQLSISTFTKTPTTADTVQTILEEIKKMRSGPPTSQELSDTKAYLAGSFPGDRETPGATVQDLWTIETEHLTADFYQRYLADIKKVRAEDVAQAARELIDPDHLVIVVVGEASKIRSGLEKIGPVTLIEKQTEEKPTASPDSAAIGRTE